MWRGYDPAVVREELRVLRDHGLSVTRSFFFWPDFMPEPDAVDEQMAARFADFLDRHAERVPARRHRLDLRLPRPARVPGR
jgi:hypothetical protein